MEPTESTPKIPTDPAQVKTWSLIAHLSPILCCFFGPLIIWLLKREESPAVGEEAKEALNMQINVFGAIIGLEIAAGIVCWLLAAIKLGFLAYALGILVYLVVLVIGIANLVFMIKAAIAINDGKSFRYPYIHRLIK